MAAPRVGVVYLVGAGPGDPGLITVRGRQLLDDCDAIVFDALANPALLPRVRDARGPELHDVGKRGGAAESATQVRINELLIALAREGKRVVRLKGGDPFVFGRGSEEAQALAAAGVPFEVVPGITAGIAAPAYAGIPVTHRGVATSVTFVTGHEDPSKSATPVDWNALAKIASTGTVVLYMGVKTLPSIAEALMEGGLPGETPAAAIEWGTHPRQRTVVATLATLVRKAAAEGIGAPVITVIGESVSLREEIGWIESRPLFGKRIVVTRASAVAGTLAERLRELGADAIEAPVTRLQPLDSSAIDAAISGLGSYDWLVLTSAFGVSLFWDALRRAGLDSRALSGLRVAVIGPATGRAVEAHGVIPDVEPKRFVAEGLLESLRTDATIRRGRVLYAAAEDSRDVLRDGLIAGGASVDMVALYRSVPDPAIGARLNALIDGGEVGVVTFASGSAVEGFVTLVGEDRARRVSAISIGPVTTAAARAHGVTVVGEAEEATIDALIEAVILSS